MSWNDVRLLLADFKAAMTNFAAIHACLFDQQWLNTHPRPVDYHGYVCALTGISAALVRLCGEATRMAAEPESQTTFRDYFAALVPYLDASRECVGGLQAYCVAMDGLGEGTEDSLAEALRLKDLYIGLGIRMHSAQQAYGAASARWGLGWGLA